MQYIFDSLRFTASTEAIVVPDFEAGLGEMVVLEGVVVREPDRRQFNQQLYLKTASATILVFADRYLKIVYGDRLRVKGKLKKPIAFATDLGRTFDYSGYLKAPPGGVGYLISFAEVRVLETGRGRPWLSFLFTGKQKFIEVLEAVIPEPQAGLGEGLLLGVNQALGEDLKTAFRKTGIIHIVVLSGYNVMIVAEAVMRLLAFWFTLRIRLLIGLVVIGGFAFLVGLGPTVVRASLMATLILVARATGRHYAVTRSLVFAGLIMLIINPYLLVFDPGFQLSFLATLALILLAPSLMRHFWFVPNFGQLREFFTATIATQIFVSPLLLYSIGEFSLVLVNVMVLPLVPLSMLLTFLTGLCGLLSFSLALPVGWLAHLTLSYIIFIAETFANLSLAAFPVPPFPFFMVPIVYSIFFLSWWFYGRRDSLAQTDNLVAKLNVELTDCRRWQIKAEVIKPS